MENLPSVNIIEVCKVAPPPAHAAAPSSLPLTFFDLLWLRFHPIQRLFFYELLPSCDSNGGSFVDDIVPRLKASLSLALRHYLPLAGNLVWTEDIPVVEFSRPDDAVSLTVAESDADFYHLSSNGFRDVSEFHPLVSHLPVSHDRAAVIALQVTTFKSRGFCIGITNHHAIIDGRTSTSFMKLWAQICKSLDSSSKNVPTPTPEQLPFYDRSLINDPTNLAKRYADAWQDKDDDKDRKNNKKNLSLRLSKPQPGLVRTTLEFTHQNLNNLKQWISKHKNSNDRISSFVLATAHLITCAAKLEGIRDGTMWFGFAADARSRLKPPVPPNYFGNCLVAGIVCIERSLLLGEKGVVVAVEEISKGVRGLDEEALKGVEDWGLMISEMSSNNSEAPGISIAGSPRFEVYSADFGWGRPVKVEVVSAESPLVFSLSDSGKSDVAMEIGVVRERSEMERFVAIFEEGFQSLLINIGVADKS